MKRKIIAICLVAMVFGIVTVSTTLAYLTDTAKATNVFSVGDVEITLSETVAVLDANGVDFSKSGITKVTTDGSSSTYTQIMPTNKIVKKVTLSNAANKSDAYVRITVVANNLDKLQAVLNDARYAESERIFVGSGWMFDSSESLKAVGNSSVLFGVDTYADDSNLRSLSSGMEADGTKYDIVNNHEIMYVYYVKLDADTSYMLDLSMDVPTSFGSKQLAMFDGLKIEVYADAIQAEGFNYNHDNGAAPSETEIAHRAFAQLEIAHPIIGLRTPASDVQSTAAEETTSAETQAES